VARASHKEEEGRRPCRCDAIESLRRIPGESWGKDTRIVGVGTTMERLFWPL